MKVWRAKSNLNVEYFNYEIIFNCIKIVKWKKFFIDQYLFYLFFFQRNQQNKFMYVIFNTNSEKV